MNCLIQNKTKIMLVILLFVNINLFAEKKPTAKIIKGKIESSINQDTISNYSTEKKLIIELICHNLYLTYSNFNLLQNNYNNYKNNDQVSKETIKSLNELNESFDKYYDWMSRFSPKKESEIKTIEEINNLISKSKEIVSLQNNYVKSKNDFEKKKLEIVYKEYKNSILLFFNKYKQIK